MRFLLSIVLLVGATALACHGYFNQDRAWDAYEALGGARPASGMPAGGDVPLTRDELIHTWPYTSAASRARADILEAWEREKPSGQGTDAVDHALARIGNGFQPELPYALPAGLAVIALGALLLACLLPRQRFRDLAILLFVLGAIACWPALAPPADEVTYVGWFDPVRHLVAWFPQMVVGLTFVAGLLLLSRRRPQPRED